MTLINKLTGSEIDTESIYSQNDEGVIIINNECFKLISWENIEKKQNAGDYISSGSIPERICVKVDKDIHNVDNIVDKAYIEKARYHFGLKKFGFYNRVFERTSAITSLPVDISGTEYITISSVEGECFNSSVEYSVLDGTIEVPLLPQGKDYVEQEKLFYGIETRFMVDYEKGEPKLYENGLLTSKRYYSLGFDDFASNEYTLSYYPAGEIHKYFPVNSMVKVKAVIRNYGDTYSPAVIRGLAINRYGGEVEWI